MAYEKYHYMKEAAEAINELVQESNTREKERMRKLLKESQDQYNEIQDIKEHHEFLRDKARMYKGKALNECLQVALNAIYISALQESGMVLTSENIKLAESLTANFIEEQGGAEALLRRMNDKNYLLETIKTIVEDAEEDAEKTSDDEEKDFEEVPTDSKEEMLDKMEKEEEVDSAVELISNRIASAEEEFIKKNAEDKEQIENIVNDLNDRIEAVKADPDKSDEVKEEIEQEMTIETKRKIRDIEYTRPRSLFDHIVTEMTTTVLKDAELKKIYEDFEGGLDMDRIIGNAKCMYGFLEFVNTVGLQTIDKEYIEEMVKQI